MIRKFLTLTLAFGFILTSCDVDQTRSAELPEVDVDVDTEAGQMPAFDVNWADVDVMMEERTVQVPKVRVVMEEETIEVPVLDVSWPDEMGDTEEMNLMVEAEVDQDAVIDIKNVFATGERLIVVAELEKAGEMLPKGEMMRVSDQVIVNAPDMDVRYYIIGDRPTGDFNKRYKYFSNDSEVKKMMNNGKVIYTAN